MDTHKHGMWTNFIEIYFKVYLFWTNLTYKSSSTIYLVYPICLWWFLEEEEKKWKKKQNCICICAGIGQNPYLFQFVTNAKLFHHYIFLFIAFIIFVRLANRKEYVSNEIITVYKYEYLLFVWIWAKSHWGPWHQINIDYSILFRRKEHRKLFYIPPK